MALTAAIFQQWKPWRRWLLRQHLPDIEFGLSSIVDLMALQPRANIRATSLWRRLHLYSNGRPSYVAFQQLSLVDSPAPPTFRPSHSNLHVHGYKGKRNDHHPIDIVVIDRIDPSTADRVLWSQLTLSTKKAHVKQIIHNKFVRHKQYIHEHGDVPEGSGKPYPGPYPKETRWAEPTAVAEETVRSRAPG